ncbi:hypothetical protein B0H13DRAFT_2510203 [Mycena leptocephala]|nr:hypothetical protein B0H13DRAFT_2510203 [Mycena leptocephala]
MARLLPIYLLGSLWAVLVALSRAQGTVFIPPAVQNVSSSVQFKSSIIGLDAPKVSPINGSVFDWWYFDVLQPAFPLLDPADTVTVARIWVSFPNGTLWSAVSNGDGATVTAKFDTSSGIWHGTGYSWTGLPLLGYLVEIDAPDIGVTGTIAFPPVAPGHYPCGPVVPGQNLQVGPHIGWENAIPDAISVVNLKIGGTKLAFVGSGYHDKNWSDQPFTTHVASWYWGHGRVGPYSIVWFDFLDVTGTEFVSAYASKNGGILAASCALGSITVRPTGPNSTYPPIITTPNPTGYHISLDLGHTEGTLEVDVAVLTNIIGANPVYARFIGNMSAEFVPVRGVATKGLKGMALFEQFKLT